MKKSRVIFPLAILSMLGLFISILAGEERVDDRFRLYELDLGREFDGFILADVDGNGFQDIVARKNRELIIFYQDESGFGTEDQKVYKFTAVSDALFFDIANIDDDPQLELVYAKPSGVFYYDVILPGTGAGPKVPWFSFIQDPLIASSCVFQEADPGNLMQIDFAIDLNDDGRDDILFPKRGRFEAYMYREAKSFALREPALRFQVESRISTGIDGFTGKFSLSYWFPRVLTADFNGDGRVDLALTTSDILSIFIQSADGAYSETPNYQIPLDRAEDDPPFGPRSQQSGGQGPQRFLNVPLMLEDLDGDKLTDIVLTNPFGGRIEVFRGEERRRSIETPDTVIQIDGWVMVARLKDLETGKLKDLVLGVTDEIGIWDVFMIWLSKEASARIEIYRGRESAGFSSRADFIQDMTIPLNFSSGGGSVKIGIAVFVEIDGDLNGDGRLDLVLLDEADKLSVRSGLREGVFSQEPTFMLDIPSTADYRNLKGDAVDMNEDGISDVIIHYKGWNDVTDKFVVLVSKK
ncbi:MAG: VCBS repeat-containing protein [Planctomycetes bacterium]|nr:VCBS repeat-containing protein [Planctomycetota bacterium]